MSLSVLLGLGYGHVPQNEPSSKIVYTSSILPQHSLIPPMVRECPSSFRPESRLCVSSSGVRLSLSPPSVRRCRRRSPSLLGDDLGGFPRAGSSVALVSADLGAWPSYRPPPSLLGDDDGGRPRAGSSVTLVSADLGLVTLAQSTKLRWPTHRKTRSPRASECVEPVTRTGLTQDPYN